MVSQVSAAAEYFHILTSLTAQSGAVNFHRLNFVVKSARSLDRLLVSFVIFRGLAPLVIGCRITTLGVHQFSLAKDAVVVSVSRHYFLLLSVDSAADF